MKNLKKIASLLLVLVMVFALAVPAMADRIVVTNQTGKITITSQEPGYIYRALRLLDLVEYDPDYDLDPTKEGNEGMYLYKINEDNTVMAAYLNQLITDGKYFNKDSEGYITLKPGADMQQFNEEAFNYIVDYNSNLTDSSSPIPYDGTVTISDTPTGGTAEKPTYSGVIENLPLGYYFVTSSLGSVVSLTTLNPNAQIQDKNHEPPFDKMVKEDSTGEWGYTNDADIGQVVEYKTTIEVQEGAQSYMYLDKMDAGLTYNKDVKVYLNEIAEANLVPAGEGADGVITYQSVMSQNLGDNTFGLSFGQRWLDSLAPNTRIIIAYTATVNEKAIVCSGPNLNGAKLQYGRGATIETEYKYTETYVWDFGVYKYDAGNENTALAGAEFRLYKTEGEVNKYGIFTAKTVNDSKAYSYTVMQLAGWTDKQEEATTLITDASGEIHLRGLDDDVYYLEETKAPAGYVKLDAPVKVYVEKVDISGDTDTANKLTHTVSIDDANAEGGKAVLTDKIVRIENKAGSLLPSTGGIGTTIFYILGGILVVGAAVLLITKKRVGAK